MTTLADLVPDPQNARRHTPRNVGLLQDSLQEVGAARSIVIDENNVVLAGNATVEAAGIAGIERVQIVDADGETIIAVRRSNLTAEQKTRLALFDNRTAELAEWDENVLAELSGAGFDLSNLWHEDELAALLAEVTQTDGGLLDDADPDAIPDASEVKTRVKTGEVWACGPHRVACIDSTDPGAVALFLSGVTPNMVWADPPYGLSIVHLDSGNVGVSAAPGFKSKGKVGVTPVTPAGVYAPIIGDETTETAEKSFAVCADVCPVAVHIWWGGNFYANALPNSPHWIIWDKQTDGNQFADAELAWTNQKGALRQFRHQWMGMHRASERGEKRTHPTQKPVALAEWCFERYGKPGDLIFDPFLGSGMSVIAAEKTGRVVYGCELSAEYCSIVLERYERATGKTAALLENVNGPSD